jgi:hypothetical protein
MIVVLDKLDMSLWAIKMEHTSAAMFRLVGDRCSLTNFSTKVASSTSSFHLTLAVFHCVLVAGFRGVL